MKIPIVLIGYPGSKKIIKVSKYLTEKYLPFLHITYLNYKGEINGWAAYIAGYLSYLTDEYVIFALDDYLVSDKLDTFKFGEAIRKLGGDVVCVKLCNSTPEEHEQYPVTTQYTIWNREYLIQLLGCVSTPWAFELAGSQMFDKICLHIPCLDYFTNSSISSRWEGVRLDGLKEEDIKYIKENELIK